jgi:hypothetical protein
MSKISGVRRLRAAQHGGTPPEYGVECQKEIIVYMQRVGVFALYYEKTYTLSHDRKRVEFEH